MFIAGTLSVERNSKMVGPCKLKVKQQKKCEYPTTDMDVCMSRFPAKVDDQGGRITKRDHPETGRDTVFDIN